MTIIDQRTKCETCSEGYHATLGAALSCRRESAERAQDRADELPLGVYVKNGQRFRVMHSARSGHHYAMLQNAQTSRYEHVPGAIKTLLPEHLVKAARGQQEARTAR